MCSVVYDVLTNAGDGDMLGFLCRGRCQAGSSEREGRGTDRFLQPRVPHELCRGQIPEAIDLPHGWNRDGRWMWYCHACVFQNRHREVGVLDTVTPACLSHHFCCRTVCAMPECVIGFVPDIGSSYFLNRLPDTIGVYMALTGKRIRGEDSEHPSSVTPSVRKQVWN